MRGFTIAAMTLVNFPGDEEHVFAPLRHTVWNGLTPTDLIAPFFLFIVGISIVLSYRTRLATGEHKTQLYRKIVVRFLKLYGLGIFLNLLPYFDVENLRYTGVLPRIAFVFLPCALLYLNTTVRQQAWIGGLLLVSYWLSMTLIPTPGTGRVMLEPGVNLAAWVDLQFLPGKMWQGTWDPEGIFSTFPSIATGITGLLAGSLLISNRSATDKVIYLMIAGLLSVITGYAWGLTFPVNENLWTSSFVLITSGMASLILGASYYLIDIRGFTQGITIGIIFGANAIAVYVLSNVLALFFYEFSFYGSQSLNEVVVQNLIHVGMLPALASMIYALAFVGINFIPAFLLFRQRIFIKL